MIQFPLPDQNARDRIRRDLDTNLLVEAGAGAGKTTEMVERMLALVANDRARCDQIAAVTFTRKAAAELRERFQNKLEEAILDARAKNNVILAGRLDAALRAIDTGFIGTIHAFCARMLREHPIEAGLDPEFHEVVEVEELVMRRNAWARVCERMAHEDARELRDLAVVGLKPVQLEPLYQILCNYDDVEFPAPEHPRPDPSRVRDRLERLLDEAEALLPSKKPAGGYDDLQNRLRRMIRQRRILRWNVEENFFEALEKALGLATAKLTTTRWPERTQEARDLHERIREFAREGGEAAGLLADWLAYRYPYAIAFARKAARSYAEDRLRTGRLNFSDLLLFAARLLREHAGARKALGNKFRYLLVDEFQDTDPIQAEILFLLASEDVSNTDWHTVTLKPGSLFVVGDPKQSIYRFRRADIGIYNQVKARFAAGQGDVVQLVSNFRSTRPLEIFVNEVFEDLLPPTATDQQAAFTPMMVRNAGHKTHGAWCHSFDVQDSQDVVVEADADRIATWIARRVRRGHRKPGDFLLLTNRKFALQVYAKALEARDVPVEVTGAAVGLEEELRELVILLEALSDPSNTVLTTAVLLGLFFGIDHEQLAQHRDVGGRFNFLEEQVSDTHVMRALRRMRQWYDLARREPADVAIPRIVEEIGLLPHAAGGELGSTRAGALLFALDAVRGAGLAGDTSLRAAIEAIRVATDASEAEAPLEPGRPDVVRVMNVHKAKGLESPVVILAFPSGDSAHPPDIQIERPAHGPARGYARVFDFIDRFTTRALAQPADWKRRAETEKAFLDAEKVRLLYVATTRAKEQLLVSRAVRSEAKSPWRLLYPHFAPEQIQELEYRKPHARQQLEMEASDLLRRCQAVAAKRAEAAQPTYTAASVRELAKKRVLGGELIEPVPLPARADMAPRGTEWGTLVHSALEVAARGGDEARIESACRGLLLEYERPLDINGEPAELAELLEQVNGMLASEIWKRAMRSGNFLIEVPFTFAQDNTVIDGVIDLIFRDTDGWVVVDYKSDVVGDLDIWQQRVQLYKRQVDLYADYWEALTGEGVEERVLYFTASKQPLTWFKGVVAAPQQLSLELG